MAKLSSSIDIARRPAPEQTPGINVKGIDYSPMAQEAKAIGGAMQSVSGMLGGIAEAGQKAEDHDLDRKLLDFRLDTEMQLEEHKRNMPAGGEGYTGAWRDQYVERAREFVGDKYANIPRRLRDQIDTKLAMHENALVERAQRDEYAERDRKTKDDLEQILGKTRSRVEADPNRLDEMHAEGARLIDSAQMPPAMKHALGRKYRETLEESAASAVADSVRDADSYARAKELLAPHRAERVTARGVRSDIIGSVSEKYESGGRGVGMVSSGKGDPGGVSYGAHQLSTKDSMPAFLRSEEGAGYAEKFGSAQPGTPEFNRIYRSLASSDGDAFAKAQKDFYSRTHYDPVREHAKSLGFNVDDRGVQEALFSMGIQHGGAKKIVDAAAATKGGTAEDQIRALYASRADYVDRLKTLPPGTKASVLDRYDREINDALALSGQRAPGEVPPGQTEVDAYDGPYQNLPLAKRRAIFARAEANFEKEKKGVEAVIKEQMSVAADGYLPPEPIMRELDRRVKAVGDPLIAAQYDTMLRNAQWTQRLQKAPPLAIEEQARILRDQASQGGTTKEGAAVIKHVEAVAASVRKQVNDNPMGWAHRTQIQVPMVDAPPADLEPRMRAQWKPTAVNVQLEQLNFGAETIDQQLAFRAEQAKGVARYYGQPPQMFTTNERDFLKDQVRKGGPAMLGVLGRITKAAQVSGIDPTGPMQEIGKDAPELAMIGNLVANGADGKLLDHAAKAFQLRHTEGDKFISQIDKAQSKPDLSEIMPALSKTPGMVDPATRLANVVYEYRHRIEGKDAFDADLYKRTLREVLGEVTENETKFGGVGRQGSGWFDGKWSHHVLVPHGVRQDSFDDLVNAMQPKDIEGSPPLDGKGKPLPIADVRSSTFLSVGRGRYLLKVRTASDGSDELAVDASGQPYVLDMTPMLPALQKRKPELFRGYAAGL